MVVGVAIGRGAFDVMVVFFADVEFAADDGLDAVFVGGVYEMHGAEDISVVGHGNGGHAEFLYALAELFHVAGAVEERVIGMEVQVDELGRGARSHFMFGVILTGNVGEGAVKISTAFPSRDRRCLVLSKYKPLTQGAQGNTG